MVLKKVNTEAAASAVAAANAADEAQTATASQGTATDQPKWTGTEAALTAPVTGPGALVKTGPKVDINVVKKLKDAHRVSYDSLAQITAGQGQFIDRETKVTLGGEILLQLLSYQDQYVISPNADTAPKDLVRYSDDGVTCTDGTDCKQHVADLKELGWQNARINSRYVLVGAVLNTEKNADKFGGKLMQIDLSPKSKAQFDRYLIQSAFDLSTGKITEDQAVYLDLTAEVATNTANQSYTKVNFATHME